jgi:carbon starvation protein
MFTEVINGRTVYHAMPLILGVLCVLAVAYRYYSAFLAAKVLALNDKNPTPAHTHNDGQNYHPTNKWVLFGHHFAAISGAGPLIGPVLAIQYGYLPGLLWLVIGVCLAGAVQDMLVLGASVRRDGKSLAEIARTELGPFASGVTSLAILFIVVIALAGLGYVVVKALGGEEVHTATGVIQVPGSSWGTFTIAATIPIALFVGLYMYRIRKGAVVEASLIGAAATLAAVVAGNWVPGSWLEPYLSLSKGQITFALCAYGFVASVLPVWMLLCPRDYLSSFLKIGTIILLVMGVILANPVMFAPPINHEFLDGGPTFRGGLFPFVFICIMCGAVSGFHALVASGTTPKMIDKETQVRPIGYGAMLIEGIVGVTALIAAASMDPKLYYDINVPQQSAAKWQPQLDRLFHELGNADLTHLPVERRDLGTVEQLVGGETLRGRTGGAVTLAVGMSFVLTDAAKWFMDPANIQGLLKYWYHFAIMFEALFILTTIDTGTRIGRFLVQEAMGKLSPSLGRTDWLPGAVFATLVVTAGWGLLVYTGSIDTIWPMFGIANQLLAVMALALVTTWLVNQGKARYAAVTLVPMLFVTATTLTAGAQLVGRQFPAMIEAGRAANQPGQVFKGWLCIVMTVAVIATVGTVLLQAAARWVVVLRGLDPPAPQPVS